MQIASSVKNPALPQSKNQKADMTPEEEQGRRFALGRFVKNAAPPEEIVAQII